MSFQFPNILALDFDGVICDGLIEYFASTKKAYRAIWSEEVGDNYADSFYRLRPVIETGWEMPILLRALVLGKSEADIINNFPSIARQIIESEGLKKRAVVNQLDSVRDDWIKNNLDDWLALHRFYPGVIEQLKRIIHGDIELYIITTKEGRFVKQLLQRQNLDFPANQIIGKESKRPKYETLRILRDRYQKPGIELTISFVEDRLKTLQQVAQQDDLNFVKLFLAEWGYNLESDRHFANKDERIKLLSLERFQQDLSAW